MRDRVTLIKETLERELGYEGQLVEQIHDLTLTTQQEQDKFIADFLQKITLQEIEKIKHFIATQRLRHDTDSLILLSSLLPMEDRYLALTERSGSELVTSHELQIILSLLLKTNPHDQFEYIAKFFANIFKNRARLDQNIENKFLEMIENKKMPALFQAVKKYMTQTEIDQAFHFYHSRYVGYFSDPRFKMYNYKEVLDFLLKCGVSPSTVITALNEDNTKKYGNLFQFYFAYLMQINLGDRNYHEIAKLALDHAIYRQEWIFMELFLNKQNQKHHPETLGNFLLYAMKNNQMSLVKKLIEAGASFNLLYQNDDKSEAKAAWDVAKNHSEMMNLVINSIKDQMIKHPEIENILSPNVLKLCIVYSKNQAEAERYLTKFFEHKLDNKDLNFNDLASLIAQSSAKSNDGWLVELLAKHDAIDREMFGQFLVVAVMEQRADRVKMLLSYNAPLDHSTPPHRNSVLHLAVIRKNPAILEMLLEKKVFLLYELNADNKTPLYLAIEQDNFVLVEMLLLKWVEHSREKYLNLSANIKIKDGDDFITTSYLLLAIQHQNIKIIEFLLSKSVIPGEKEYEAARRNPEILKLLTQKTDQYNNELKVQKEDNKLKMLREMIYKYQPHLNSKHIVSLYESDKVDSLRRVLNYIMSEEKSENDLIQKDKVSLLHDLFIKNPLEISPKELQSIFQFQAQNGDTILHWLFKNDNHEFSRLTPNIKLNILDTLVNSYRVDPNIKNNLGLLPVAMAKAKGEFLLSNYLSSENKHEYYTTVSREGIYARQEALDTPKNKLASTAANALLGDLSSIRMMATHYHGGRSMIMYACAYVISGDSKDLEEMKKFKKNSLLGDEKKKLISFQNYFENNKEKIRLLHNQYKNVDPISLILFQLKEVVDKDALFIFQDKLSDFMKDPKTLHFKDAQVAEEMNRRDHIIEVLLHPPSAPPMLSENTENTDEIPLPEPSAPPVPLSSYEEPPPAYEEPPPAYAAPIISPLQQSSPIEQELTIHTSAAPLSEHVSLSSDVKEQPSIASNKAILFPSPSAPPSGQFSFADRTKTADQAFRELEEKRKQLIGENTPEVHSVAQPEKNEEEANKTTQPKKTLLG